MLPVLPPKSIGWSTSTTANPMGNAVSTQAPPTA